MRYYLVFTSNWLKLPGMCLYLILNFTQEGRTQETNDLVSDKWTLGAGILFNKSIVSDKNFSSIPYSGQYPGATLSLKYQKRKVSHEVQVYYTAGTLQASTLPGNELTQKYISGDYTNLYRLGKYDGQSFMYKAGAALNVLYAKRNYSNFINNNESSDLAASLSGVLEVSYFFSNRLAGFSISDRISLPFVSYILQPAFGSEDTHGPFGKNSRVTGFSSFFRVLNFLSLDKTFSNRQTLSFSYGWDYYQFLRAREVKQANHRLGLTYSFIF